MWHYTLWQAANSVRFSQINLFLRIIQRRPDGYHDLASLFHVRKRKLCSYKKHVIAPAQCVTMGQAEIGQWSPNALLAGDRLG